MYYIINLNLEGFFVSTFERNLEKYAVLAVEVGVNLQKDQILSLEAPLTAAPFVHKIVKHAYKVGARHVTVHYMDDELTKLALEMQPEEGLKELPSWIIKRRQEAAEQGAAFLQIYVPNPDLLKDIPSERISTYYKTLGTAMEKWRQYTMNDRVSWSLISMPTPLWAKKIFPDLEEQEGMDKLWDTIFSMVRVDNDDPIAAWKKHNESLLKTCDYLNEKQYTQLVYTGGGTDFTLNLVENHVWKGGGATNIVTNNWFNPNLPTEEVFTMPHKDGANGVVHSTKPLNYAGNLIDNFTITFKDGKVVDFTAEKGYDTLKTLLEIDEGASRLGEVALVPHESPISLSNLTFYNTLYDENASCHLALGKAYPTNIENGAEQTMEELSKRGVNNSLVHEDFMIGSQLLNIDGVTKDGKREPIFRDGNWALEL